MSDDLEMHRYRDADREGVFELVRAAFSQEYARRLIRQWDWKYAAHSLNREATKQRSRIHEKIWPQILDRYSVADLAHMGLKLDHFDTLPDDAPYILLMKNRGEIVAMQGSVPQAFHISGLRRLVAVGCDLAVHPNYQGARLSMRLAARQAIEHRLTFGWASHAAQQAGAQWASDTLTRAQQQRRTARGGSMRLVALVKPIDWAYMSRRETGIGSLGNIAAVVASGARRVSDTFRNPEPTPSANVVPIESFDARFDRLWERCCAQYQVIGIRDRAYLNWRFRARPDASYQCLASVRDSEIIGYLVYRTVERDGALTGYLADFLCDGAGTSIFATLLQHAEEQMVAAGVKSIVCIVAREPFRTILRRSGFYPALFRSSAYAVAAITFRDPRLEMFSQMRRWFITIADGDAEMSF